MPTSKTIYEAFDGKEFPDEASAKEHEKFVRKRGIELRKEFFGKGEFGDGRHGSPEIRDFMNNFSDNDAWKAMRALWRASIFFHEENNSIDYSMCASPDDWLGTEMEND